MAVASSKARSARWRRTPWR